MPQNWSLARPGRRTDVNDDGVQETPQAAACEGAEQNGRICTITGRLSTQQSLVANATHCRLYEANIQCSLQKMMALMPSNCWKIMKTTAVTSCGRYFLFIRLPAATTGINKPCAVQGSGSPVEAWLQVQDYGQGSCERLTVGVLDQVGLASSLHDVCVLHLDIWDTTDPLQHLQHRQAARLQRCQGPSVPA